MSRLDLYNVNDILNDMVIIDKYKDSYQQPVLKVQCKVCGNIKTIHLNSMSDKSTIHGSYCKIPVEEQFPIGTIINDMVVIGYNINERRRKDIVVQCTICGKQKVIQIGNIKRGTNATCHIYCDRAAYNNYNGLATQHARLYKIWRGIMNRIYNQNDTKYPSYGGRGLTCDYNTFEEFLNELGQSYYDHVSKYGEIDTSIDRINNNFGYIRGNVRWATKREQSQNRMCMNDNFFLAYSPDGNIYLSNNQSDFARNHNLNRGNLSNCLNGGANKSVCGWRFSKVNPLFLPQNVIEELVTYNG